MTSLLESLLKSVEDFIRNIVKDEAQKTSVDKVVIAEMIEKLFDRKLELALDDLEIPSDRDIAEVVQEELGEKTLDDSVLAEVERRVYNKVEEKITDEVFDKVREDMVELFRDEVTPHYSYDESVIEAVSNSSLLVEHFKEELLGDNAVEGIVTSPQLSDAIHSMINGDENMQRAIARAIQKALGKSY